MAIAEIRLLWIIFVGPLRSVIAGFNGTWLINAALKQALLVIHHNESQRWNTVFCVFSSRAALEIDKWTRHDDFHPTNKRPLLHHRSRLSFNCLSIILRYAPSYLLQGFFLEVMLPIFVWMKPIFSDASVTFEKMTKNSFFLPSLRQQVSTCRLCKRGALIRGWALITQNTVL